MGCLLWLIAWAVRLWAALVAVRRQALLLIRFNLSLVRLPAKPPLTKAAVLRFSAHRTHTLQSTPMLHAQALFVGTKRLRARNRVMMCAQFMANRAMRLASLLRLRSTWLHQHRQVHPSQALIIPPFGRTLERLTQISVKMRKPLLERQGHSPTLSSMSSIRPEFVATRLAAFLSEILHGA